MQRQRKTCEALTHQNLFIFRQIGKDIRHRYLQPLNPESAHVEPRVVERLLGGDAAAPVGDEGAAQEVARLGRHGVPGGRREAEGALQHVHQRLRVRAAQERGLAAQPARR